MKFPMKFKRAMPPAPQRGMTLIELMISMVIGMFLLLGTLTVYQQSRSNFRVSDSVARLQENARFIIDLMEPDIRLAKYWGISPEPGAIGLIPAPVVVTCDTIDTSAAMLPATTYTAWALNVLRPIQGVDETSGYAHATLGIPCSPRFGAGTAQFQSDALIVRHAAGQPAALQAGIVQVHTGLMQAAIFNNGVAPFVPADPARAPTQTHNVVANIYYVSQASDLDPLTPSLRMKTLIAGGIHQDQELLPGVENLQVQFGISTNNNHNVERYVDPDHAALNIPGVEIVSVRLWMLMRADRMEVGFTDMNTYVTPDPDFNITPCAPGPGCNYPSDHRRLVASKTILLRNTR
ncbi:MAG: prepilin-type N-terminal cleavage/methylation domain-containing protein [Gammaproteobacteria bacterium]|nr:MAG: prepilin-type N-terminal cleavage/methylation domain-containing protein [Gammaproteobacteria bacterium]